MNTKKSILRGEGQYSSNNSTNPPVDKLKPTEHEPPKKEIKPQAEIAEAKPEPKDEPMKIKTDIDIEDSVDNEFNILINRKSDQFKPAQQQPRPALEPKEQPKLEPAKQQSAFVPESDDSKSEHPANVTKGSVNSIKEPKPEAKASKPPEIDFFDEKVDLAHKEIQKQEEEDEYYDEEEDDLPTAEAQKLRIMVSPASRIDETIEGMESEKKLKFAGMLCEYIEINIQAFTRSKKAETTSLFEKPRETNVDRGMKFKLITRYNELLDKFSRDKTLDKDFDLGIPCDLLLDLLRYEDSEILNPNLVVQDFAICQKQGSAYTPKDFYKRVKNEHLMMIIREIFKMIVKAKEHRLYKSQSQVAYELSQAIILETQEDMKSELQKVIRNLVEQQTGMSATQSVGAQSSQKGKGPLQQMQAAASGKSASRKALDEVETVRVSDALRFEVASELVSSLQAVLKSNNTAALSDVAAIVNQMKSPKTMMYLVDISERAKGDAEMVELPS